MTMRKKIVTLSLACLLLLYLVSCSTVTPVIKRTSSAQLSDFLVWTPDFRSEEVKNSYVFKLTTSNNSVTGLFFLKKINDEWIGMLTHEMSVKVFDVVVTGEKCELRNVISMMDKWYIKKTVAADLFFFIQVDNPSAPFFKHLVRFEQNGNQIVNYKKKQVVVGQDGSVRMVNKRRNLQYELRKMSEIDPDRLIL